MDHSSGPYWEPVFEEEEEIEIYEISTPEPEMSLAVPSTNIELEGIEAAVAAAQLRLSEHEFAQAEEAQKGAKLQKAADDLLNLQKEQTRMLEEAVASAKATSLEEEVAAAAREAQATQVELLDAEEDELNASTSAAASESGASVVIVQPSKKKEGRRVHGRLAWKRRNGCERGDAGRGPVSLHRIWEPCATHG